jgi:hypothetical protein
MPLVPPVTKARFVWGEEEFTNLGFKGWKIDWKKSG